MEPESRESLDVLFSLAYGELRRLASKIIQGDGCVTLTPTSLVNEAWLKLARTPAVAQTSPLHFKRIAARAMRQVLVEAARRRATQIRGNGAFLVSFDEFHVFPATVPRARDVLALDSALDELSKLAPRQARLIEDRFFGGLDVEESANLLGISRATAMREWRLARAWLACRIGDSLDTAT